MTPILSNHVQKARLRHPPVPSPGPRILPAAPPFGFPHCPAAFPRIRSSFPSFTNPAPGPVCIEWKAASLLDHPLRDLTKRGIEKAPCVCILLYYFINSNLDSIRSFTRALSPVYVSIPNKSNAADAKSDTE